MFAKERSRPELDARYGGRLVSPEFTPVDDGWNATIPKVIDNAILYAVQSGKYK